VGNNRLGILGGTFDPIHVGHIETARAAQRQLGLHDLLVMPARIPPHREQGPSASMFHRFAMVALAVADLEGAAVSDEELRADGPSYTALTLERLSNRGFDPCEIFFITGADAFAEIETWYRYPEVLDLAQFAVVSRPGTPAASIPDRLPQLRSRIVPGNVARPSIFLVDAATPDVSSTDLRRRLRAGEPITGLVPPQVEAHIRRHRLYAATATAEHVR
jgi:nicotinate-nucleotide adenylyltransferase